MRGRKKFESGVIEQARVPVLRLRPVVQKNTNRSDDWHSPGWKPLEHRRPFGACRHDEMLK